MIKIKNDILLTQKEVVRWLGISRMTLWFWEGKGLSSTQGWPVLYSKRKVERFVKKYKGSCPPFSVGRR